MKPTELSVKQTEMLKLKMIELVSYLDNPTWRERFLAYLSGLGDDGTVYSHTLLRLLREVRENYGEVADIDDANNCILTDFMWFIQLISSREDRLTAIEVILKYPDKISLENPRGSVEAHRTAFIAKCVYNHMNLQVGYRNKYLQEQKPGKMNGCLEVD